MEAITTPGLILLGAFIVALFVVGWLLQRFDSRIENAARKQESDVDETATRI